MPRNIGYPAKTRSVAADQAFPAKSRSIAVEGVMDAPKPTQHGNPKDGKPPKKGVLTSGGGHG